MLIVYSLRSVWSRRLSASVPIFITAIAIGGAACSAACLQGFADVLRNTSRRIAVVARPSIRYEDVSTLDLEDIVRTVGAMPGHVGRAADAADLVAQLPCNASFVRYRAVSPNAASFHSGVVLPAGAIEEGKPGVLVGAMLAMERPELRPPGTVRVAGATLPILGVFDAPGTPYESEIWTSRSTLIDLRLVSGYSTLRLPVADESELVSLREVVARMFPGTLEVRTERNFYDSLFIRGDRDGHEELVLLTLLLLVVAGTVANLNATYSVALGRRNEFFTLSMIGFRRARIIGLVLQEAIAVSLIGGTIGVLLAYALTHGRFVLIGETDVVSVTRFSPQVIGAALILSLVMAVVGGGLAAIQAISMGSRSSDA